MSEEPPVDRGRPDAQGAVALLRAAYGDWGDEALFAWKYDEDPAFRPEHCFSIALDGELAAFRRLFDRRIRGLREYDCFVLGDTCVAPDHQGQGLYSALHAETTQAVRDAGRDFSATFNRRGTITFAANADRGWRWRPLPLSIRILSPAVVLPEYAALALEEGSRLTGLLESVGDRVELRFADGSLRADRLLEEHGGGGGEPAWTVPVPVPHRLLEAGVKAVVGDPKSMMSDAADTVAGLPRRFGTTIRERDRSHARTTVRDGFDVGELGEVQALYERVLDRYDLHFRRDRETVRHLLDHPYIEGIATVRRDGELVGMAPVCRKRSGTVEEAHVLDLVGIDDAAIATLVDGVEAIAREIGADAVIAVTDQNLGSGWIGVDRQVLMWDDYGVDTSLLEQGSLFVSMYDVEMG